MFFWTVMIYDSKQAKKTVKKGSMSEINIHNKWVAGCKTECKKISSVLNFLDKRATRILDDAMWQGRGRAETLSLSENSLVGDFAMILFQTYMNSKTFYFTCCHICLWLNLASGVWVWILLDSLERNFPGCMGKTVVWWWVVLLSADWWAQFVGNCTTEFSLFLVDIS